MVQSSQQTITDLNNNNNNNIDVYVSNIVCTFSTKCRLDLRKIALKSINVEYKKESNKIVMRLKSPSTTSVIFSSGKINCSGANSEKDAYKAARRVCRLLQKIEPKVQIENYRVVNMMANCSIPFMIDLRKLSLNYPKECLYEPELDIAANLQLNIDNRKVSFRIFSNGSVTLMVNSTKYVRKALIHIYPILFNHKRNAFNNTTNLNLV